MTNPDPRTIEIGCYDYPLPDSRIARHPLAQRDACKLLVDAPGADGPAERVFAELPALLPPDAMLVYNDTRVINARLRMHKATGALIEIFCLEPASPADYAVNFASTDSCVWTCLVGNSKRWKEGSLTADIVIDGRPCVLSATRLAAAAGTAFDIRFDWTGGFTFAEVIGAAGVIPIPPYLNRDTEQSDSADYQTVYGHIDGSVAAPTAGLHFTPAVLDAIDARSIARRRVTLHVGAGTFQPVKSDTIGDHPMHSEYISVDLDTIEALAAHLPRPVVAVGTTSVRTLESLYHIGCLIAEGRWHGEVPQWYPYEPSHPCLEPREALDTLARYLREHGQQRLVADTRIIIAPGYTYRIVGGMVTNFHQPRSTLLLLVSAFLGGERWRDIYSYALDRDFRFLSYGDACLFLRN